MQTVLLCCFYGVVGMLGLWAAVSAAVTRDQMMQRGGRLFLSEDV
jgi:hypothetical protein